MEEYRINYEKLEKYFEKNNIQLDTKKVVKNNNQKIAVICYAKNEFGEYLLLERFKEPFPGKLVAPGGKTYYDESIEDSIFREFKEETGIKLNNTKLKVITSEDGPEHYNWILFIFTSEIKKQNLIDCDEGILRWVYKDDIKTNNITSIDAELLDHIFGNKKKYVDISYITPKEFTINEIIELN
ncbi:NUDIX domain-containing protein [Geotoga petraea]|jgi:8-oxo-dGTP diphosphatase|uniref:8-oxo-dGTP diphosphatase n=1 Tax=Geotoga petraea TaxID=28234 RepID=A0A1G6QDA0_9BACT|nr:NUDIX domain-containing protein [Geotoga petraea]MDK2945876.1 8-oxo-dGTP diphosphatase [Geotoga sp.]TGG89317.1 NUDIX domain-containing protein [Geotoga petraea]SDC90472.1 8-oxo-dGTP diphosphatase [Geotoga petraea]